MLDRRLRAARQEQFQFAGGRPGDQRSQAVLVPVRPEAEAQPPHRPRGRQPGRRVPAGGAPDVAVQALGLVFAGIHPAAERVLAGDQGRGQMRPAQPGLRPQPQLQPPLIGGEGGELAWVGVKGMSPHREGAAQGLSQKKADVPGPGPVSGPGVRVAVPGHYIAQGPDTGPGPGTSAFFWERP